MKTKLSFTLEESIIATVRKFATDDHRPISNAIDLLLMEALQARGLPLVLPELKPKKGKAAK